MKISFGIIPCKDRFFLDKALSIIKPGLEEIVALTGGEDTYFKIASDLYSGQKQLEMIYLDIESVPEDKAQAAVIGKMLGGGEKDYVGFLIIELWPNSIHGYGLYLLPQYREQRLLNQIYGNFEKQARLLGAPYMTFCTKKNDEAKHFGFVETYTKYQKRL